MPACTHAIETVLGQMGVKIERIEPEGVPAILLVLIYDTTNKRMLEAKIVKLLLVGGNTKSNFRIETQDGHALYLNFPSDAKRSHLCLYGSLEGQFTEDKVTATFMTIPALLAEPNS